MSSDVENMETRAEAWERRAALRNKVDFTMMYMAHDAFTRDLDRLSLAAWDGVVLEPPARRTWDLFSRMLEVHHKTEDAALWPRLREAVSADGDAAIIDAMEAEHAAIDPLLRAITAAFDARRGEAIAASLSELTGQLGAHMRHEEDEALPLVERTLGDEGWEAFGREAHRQTGMRDVATILPWLLDEAPEAGARTILEGMPAPVRLAFRYRWQPRYHKMALLR